MTVTRYGIPQDFTSSDQTLNFPAKLPKRVFVAFVLNTSVTGTITENPFDFRPFGATDVTLTANGTKIPGEGLKMDFATGDYQRAYLNTLAALGIDNANQAINLKPIDFATGFTIFGFKLAPGPIDGTVVSSASSTGSVKFTVEFSAGLAAPVDVIVYAESPATLEIDQLSAVTLV